MIAPGTIIANRYRIVNPLGAGGMKAVYLAEDLRFRQRRCALAVMVDSFTSDDARRLAVANFEREADVLAQLDHRSIPKVSDRFSEQDHHYFVMDYVPGMTLEEKLGASGGRLAQAEVINLALQICDALNYLHTRIPPIIYRDLKPSNIMVAADSKIKLVDFGIARHFTRQGTNVGTIGYAAPEQYQGQCDPRSDIYALGATVYHLLSGRDPAKFPFQFPPLTTVATGCDPRLEQLVSEALKHESNERLPTIVEFARRLRLITAPRGSADNALFSALPSAGMQICPRCTANVPADARQCPSCGEATAAFSPTSHEPSITASAGAATARLCPQCRRELPDSVRSCPYCFATLEPSGTGRGGMQPLPADARNGERGAGWSGAASAWLALIAVTAIVMVFAGFVLVRGMGSRSDSMIWPIWIVAGLALLVVEVHYTRDFTMFCFGVSALAIGVLGGLGVFDIWLQWIGFAALSTALLFWARGWLRRKMSGRPGHAELENIIGQTAIPIGDLSAYGFGKAELRGTVWNAHNAGHVQIVRGQRCRVMKMNGLTLWILPE
jgi:serine/threonine protein kinase/membrane protein implicated in regulation of membrane protease activity